MEPNYASVGRRFLAALADGLILAAVNAVLVLLFAKSSTAGQTGRSLLSALIGLAYYVYFIGSRGQTPGKMALGIKVVKTDGSQPNYVTAFLREVVGKILSSVVFLLGYLWAIWDAKKQTWHDKIAGTLVIKV